MSEIKRVAVVSEGITDYIVIQAALKCLLPEAQIVLKLLQPEESVAFTGAGNAGDHGGGWCGVYKWCLQASDIIDSHPVFANFDILIIQLDADVAGDDGTSCGTPEPIAGLPCEAPCPPAAGTTDALRALVRSWLKVSPDHPQIVFCTPSKSMEAWVICMAFPADKELNRQGWECHPNPAKRLGQQPKKARFDKSGEDYQVREPLFIERWPQIEAQLSEASRFAQDVRRCLL
ncbi:MAG: hypothetical protein ACRC8S_13855 [Fimbriiglobus sp.]